MKLSALVLPLFGLSEPPASGPPPVSASIADWSNAGCPGAARGDPLGWAVPDFARLQTGGYLGAVAVGVGYSWLADVMNTSLGYGFSPAWISGRTVHAGQLLHTIRPLHVSIGCWVIVAYGGAGLLFTGGNGYFFEQPERYDRFDSSYYTATAFYGSAHFGLELGWRQPRGSAIARHGLIAELVSLFTYAAVFVENPDTVSPLDVVALALGYRVAF